MALQVSPGVNITETDLTASVPVFSTTQAAIAGVFAWGPAFLPTLVEDEPSLVAKFGEPTEDNFETFFSGASFLSYGNALYVSRVVDDTATNAIGLVSPDESQESIQINNHEDFERTPNPDTNVAFAAKYPGDLGNALAVHICETAEQYSSTISLSGANAESDSDVTGIYIDTGASTGVLRAQGTSSIITEAQLTAVLDAWVAKLSVGDNIVVSNDLGSQTLSVATISETDVFVEDGDTGIKSVTREITFDENYRLVDEYSSDTISRQWRYANIFDTAPSTSPYVEARGGSLDEIHVAIEDVSGEFTGLPNTVIERWSGLSRATDARGAEGGTNYFKTVINEQSSYIYAINAPVSNYTAKSTGFAKPLSADNARVYRLADGNDSASEGDIAIGSIAKGYDLFTDKAKYDTSLIIQGKARGGTYGQVLGIYILDTICAKRKDCVGFVSPSREIALSATWMDSAVKWRNALPSTSYGFATSNYKYAYDKYNDVYRWVPLNGDMAGLTARTDRTDDPWFSPAGFNRGQLRNVIKLSHSPTEAQRDVLYRNGINPVTSFPGRGHVLYGDKTLLATRSAFDRINVRRLFIVAEKSIGRFAQDSVLFELNNTQTRKAFVSAVEPYLRDIQGREGITDFKVVADETNNTPEVIDAQSFKADIFIKPARSINFIQLQFTAVRTGVEFTEIVGA